MQYHDDELRKMIENRDMTQNVWECVPHAQRERVSDKSGLCAELIGREGCRVAATLYRERVRFHVGKSTGWRPCHLRMHNVTSRGGDAITPGTLENVVIIIRRARK